MGQSFPRRRLTWMDPLLLPGGFCVWFSDPRGPATLFRSQPGPHDDTTLLRPQRGGVLAQRGGVLAQRGGVLPQRGAALAQIREVVFWPRRWCSGPGGGVPRLSGRAATGRASYGMCVYCASAWPLTVRYLSSHWVWEQNLLVQKQIHSFLCCSDSHTHT